MDLPDDLAELERELAARRRQPPSEDLRGRVLLPMQRERTRLKRRRWRLIIGGAMAAALVVAAFMFWNRNGPVPPNEPSLATIQPLEANEAFLTQRAYRRAMEQSPDGLEGLLEGNWLRRRASLPRQVLTRGNPGSLNLNGDLQ